MTGRGRGRGGGYVNKPYGICWKFREGKCTFGARCRYSHEGVTSDSQANAAAHNSRPAQRDPATRQAEDSLHRFKQLLHRAPSSNGRLASDVSPAFFQSARNILDGDLGAAQEVIRLLAQDEGLAFVRHLAKHTIPDAQASDFKLHLWQTQVKPFFEAVTHDRIVDSAVLEQHLATIYNFMMGVNDDRARVFLGFATDLLADATDTQKSAITILSLALIYKMIDCNTNNIVSGVFEPYVKALSATIQTIEGVSEHDKLQMSQHIAYLNRRLDIGAAMPFLQTQQQPSASKPTFQLEQDLPGHLSKHGPRHDNDHANISAIKILPTYDEIMSVRPEYLPTTDTSTFHRPGIEGRIDREFRLLREDTVGQLRDAVKRQIDVMSKSPLQRRQDVADRTVRTHVYSEAKVVKIEAERRQGLSIDVSFQQPAKGSDAKHRQDWWEASKRLQPGALVCVVSDRQKAFFAVVSEQRRPSPDPHSRETNKQPEVAKLTLFKESTLAYVCLNLADESQDTLHQLLDWSSRPQVIKNTTRWFLVEFPGVLLPSFRYTLEALQSLSDRPDLPFSELLAPLKSDSEQRTTQTVASIKPPIYATKPNFSFDLACLANDSEPLQTSALRPLSPEKLAEKSPLDPTQSSALLSALNHSLALIQGPPGTGKSYTGEKVIKVLLANKTRASLGPILCVCYTNHALDQLLEHLLDSGVSRIIRIGSRSKSERLEKLNLREVGRSGERTRTESAALYTFYGQLDDQVDSLNNILAQLEASDGKPALQAFLARYNHEHHARLFSKPPDDKTWQKVVNDPHRRFNKWLTGGDKTSGTERTLRQLEVASLDSMSAAERLRLFRHWRREMRAPLIRQVSRGYTALLRISKERDKTMKDVDLRCLNQADVIGVTTTGLARNNALLQRLRSKVLLCEEAGEVLEAHSITALLPSVQHAILIGDHLQLPPQTQNYELQSTHPRGAKHALDVSLFQRLVQPPYDDDPRLPYSTLETQRRMHPSISQLVRVPLYPRLVDGGAVADYPEVVGMRKRLFWFDHRNHEDQATGENTTLSTSRTNQFEVKMTIKLVQHLVRQGEYGRDDIAVITPYLGQLHRLRRQMSNVFEVTVGDRDLEELATLEAGQVQATDASTEPLGRSTISKTTVLRSIRLATVDNFQGEEAKVIIISLVRSNADQRCGFLRTSNRINVLLSRAKHGMYIIGDSSTYGGVPMWSQVLQILRSDDNIGEKLDLRCPRHPDTVISVSQPDHFLQFAPEGGCQAACDRRLACGHACVTRCHAQPLHDAVKCLEPCPRPRKDCQHSCRLLCGDTCPEKCLVELADTTLTLPCGHDYKSPICWQALDMASIRCTEPVTHIVSGCEHRIVLPCHADVLSKSFTCPEKCDALLPCGHSCRKACSSCRPRSDSQAAEPNHGVCLHPCARDFTTCQHSCAVCCHDEEPCPPCAAPCDVRCSHSKCDKKCSEPCAPCAEQRCASHCPHGSCTMP